MTFRNKSKQLCLRLILPLLLLMIPISAKASQEGFLWEYVPNPYYEEFDPGISLYAEEPEGESEDPANEEPIEYETGEAAAAFLNSMLLQRSDVISFQYVTDNDDLKGELRTVWRAALMHDLEVNPCSGDYLKFQYAGYKVRISYRKKDGMYHCTVTYEVRYYDDAEKEAVVTEKVQEILAGIDTENLSQEEIIRAIYDYVSGHVTYDHENLYNSDYTAKYSAYAALIDGKAVCQGYSLAFYRLCRECGIDARIIPGTTGAMSHAWNIVELDGLYYNLDTTWESTGYTPGMKFRYYLLSPTDFTGHTREADYETEEFHARYPMAETSFVIPGSEEEEEPEPVLPIGIPENLVVVKDEGQVLVSWDAVSDETVAVDGYEIYAHVSGEEYSLLQTVEDPAVSIFVDENTYLPGTAVYYKICCYYMYGEDKARGDFSETKGVYFPMPVPTFTVTGSFTGKNVTFTCNHENTVIYYSTAGSDITTEDLCVESGAVVPFSGFYGSVYARAYNTVTERFGNPARLILKVGTLPEPKIYIQGGYCFIVSVAPGSYINYTVDGEEPDWEKGTKVFSNMVKIPLALIEKNEIKQIKAATYRNCYQSSAVSEFAF